MPSPCVSMTVSTTSSHHEKLLKMYWKRMLRYSFNYSGSPFQIISSQTAVFSAPPPIPLDVPTFSVLLLPTQTFNWAP